MFIKSTSNLFESSGVLTNASATITNECCFLIRNAQVTLTGEAAAAAAIATMPPQEAAVAGQRPGGPPHGQPPHGHPAHLQHVLPAQQQHVSRIIH